MKLKDVVMGERYIDTLHEWEGIATAKIEYINGCEQVLLEEMDKLKIEEMWFDVQRLKPVKVLKKTKKAPARKARGGPQSTPPSRYNGR